MKKELKAYRTGQGAWQISWSEGGQQKTLYLGKDFTHEKANKAANVVTKYLEHRKTGVAITATVSRDLRRLPKRILSKLQKMEIATDSVFSGQLREICDLHFRTKKHLKAKTCENYLSSYKMLLSFFGENKNVMEMGVDDAAKFVAQKQGQLAGTTILRELRRWKNLFAFAEKNGFCTLNPFEELRAGKSDNPSRQFFVTRSSISEVLRYCRDDYDRLAIVLGRFGGLRVPSEIRGLTFGDFSDDQIQIHEDTKTGARIVPLFAEIREIFERIGGAPGERIFGNRFDNRKATWKMLANAVQRAGLERWPKLWTNLRSTRITELIKLGYSEKTLDNIFGNSAAIRSKHYEQWQREEEYRRVLADNEAIVRYLSENGGQDIRTDSPFFVQEVLDLVKRT